jgi:hypothetical protein
MEKVTVYKTSDGRTFDDEKTAGDHEASLLLEKVLRGHVHIFDHEGLYSASGGELYQFLLQHETEVRNIMGWNA